MTACRALRLAAIIGVLLPAAASGQDVRARSADYLFITTAADARAIWVNPAGLGALPIASLMAELVLDRAVTDDLRVGQWSAGLSSRGISFGYKRDRHPDDDDTQAFRVGLGLPFTRGALGASFTFYDSDRTQRGLDQGVLLRAAPSLTLAGVLRNVGRPDIAGDRLPITGVAGVGWAPFGPAVQFAGEVIFLEGIDGVDADILYRAGGTVTFGAGLPLSGFAALDLGSRLSLDRWAVGIAVGGGYQGIGVMSGNDAPRVERLSATALARRVVQRR